MPDVPGSPIEGRLIAHRKLLAFLLAELPENCARALDFLDEHVLVQDGQEDPGAVPSAALVVGSAAIEEFRIIREDFSRYRAETKARG